MKIRKIASLAGAGIATLALGAALLAKPAPVSAQGFGVYVGPHRAGIMIASHRDRDWYWRRHEREERYWHRDRDWRWHHDRDWRWHHDHDWR